MDKEKSLVVDVNEFPGFVKWFFLSFQHVFAMFGATILVPILTGYPVSVALFASGVGTLIYTFCTKAKVPVYLGSSFAYITAVCIAVKAMGGKDISAAQTGLVLVGIIYVVVAIIIHFIGKDWIDKLLPPIVIGPMIVALVTFLVAALISSQAKGFLKIVPFLVAVVVGYILSLCFGLIDFSKVVNAAWIAVPEFKLPFVDYQFYFGPETLAILPVAIVTISEHIGDHTVLGKICGKNFLKDPGLERTLVGDGVATAVSALIGGPANTTYGENTGVIGLTKIGSVYVTCGAACIAILLSFCGKITALISTIPKCVLGGMSILLYGVIASNGLRILVDSKVDFSKQRNLIIASAMLVIGLGGAVFPLGGSATLSGTALAAIVGVVLNLILPEKSEN